jgi:hypothetical protein
MEMAREVLGGPADEGRANYQIAVSVCAESGAGRQEAGPEAVTIGPEVVAMASCDAQHLGRVDVFEQYDARPANDATPTPMAHRANDELPRAIDASGTHVGPPASERPLRPPVEALKPHVGRRAKQDIPPSLRRAVLRRDGARCRVPGCRNCRFLDLHHIERRSEGAVITPTIS